ncbi:hypothetical protein K0U27_07090 [archaeon]|nr:hypothetical protein [archaeon]
MFSASTEKSFAQIDEPKVMVGNQAKVIQEYSHLRDQRERQEYNGPPSIYDAGIHLLGIGKIDKTEGTYELDLWFWVRINEKNDPTDFTVTKPEFDFVNSKEIEIESETVEPHFYEARIQGTFRNNMDFHNFPFEKLNLQMTIEPTAPNTAENVIFVLDPESIIDPAVGVPGFEIGVLQIMSKEFTYTDGEKYDRFIADFEVERSSVGSLFKNLFPITLIAGLSLIVFWIPENYTPRIYLTAPLLIAMVYLHRATVGEIPSVGYMTLFDNIMIIYYVLFLNSLLSLGIQMRLHVTSGDEGKVKKVNRIMSYFIPIIIGIGALFILIP